ncbi:hypothetical protein [Corynebacterium amycolatum]|uniref:hypothetical protein n=1 Tax=Corynebacterium amycolatum TaxID=43765 RepID=UPI000E14D7FC|nr:hypothetical protein [Corynebacterium amycolatum]STC40308.1 Uncharacterised protein [Corynebacterium amycolatum]
MKKLVVGALTAVVSSIVLAAPVDAQPVVCTINPKDEYPIEIVHLVERQLQVHSVMVKSIF